MTEEVPTQYFVELDDDTSEALSRRHLRIGGAPLATHIGTGVAVITAAQLELLTQLPDVEFGHVSDIDGDLQLWWDGLPYPVNVDRRLTSAQAAALPKYTFYTAETWLSASRYTEDYKTEIQVNSAVPRADGYEIVKTQPRYYWWLSTVREYMLRAERCDCTCVPGTPHKCGPIGMSLFPPR